MLPEFVRMWEELVMKPSFTRACLVLQGISPGEGMSLLIYPLELYLKLIPFCVGSEV